MAAEHAALDPLLASDTGIYLTYPRTRELKKVGDRTPLLVNYRHTKLGLARTSFHASAVRYRRVFADQVKFIPLARLSVAELDTVGREIQETVARHFPRLAPTADWFDTHRRELLIALVYRALSQVEDRVAV